VEFFTRRRPARATPRGSETCNPGSFTVLVPGTAAARISARIVAARPFSEVLPPFRGKSRPPLLFSSLFATFR
jgi:hypothetical protein